jgi:hypothetical protein
MENEKERFSPFKICVRYAANFTGDENGKNDPMPLGQF